MKFIFLTLLVMVWSKGISTADGIDRDAPNDGNVIIITLDGYRWQELFGGADPALINNKEYTAVPAQTKERFWHSDVSARREKLMPFVWNVIAKKGQLFGNRSLGSKVNTKNFYSVSYPGYNEIFTGNADPLISSNKKIKNKNENLLEYLNKLPAYKGRIAAFTSWDVFPFILAEDRSKIYVNSGYDPKREKGVKFIQTAFKKSPELQRQENISERSDLLTFLSAKEYLLKNHPKVLFIGLGGTDSYGHQKKYDRYLAEAHSADRFIAELWQITQADAFYKDNTTFVITTDHGRGNKEDTWYKHGAFFSGSSQTWIMLLGKGIKPMGEAVGKGQIYQKHIAGTIGQLIGVRSFSKWAIPADYFTSNPPSHIALR